ncbi:hypothetical protein [Microvirga splendida]|uniref:Uncharacterized protein n=1 Tax=Microvirga splendida TaxID=2795727 RepID=A0ABS0Y3G3_9HYPH|nr:hypothetical protein [Microvirga splendida]MBJ6126849.1 hypothetical protein [Microvirga splendida]
MANLLRLMLTRLLIAMIAIAPVSAAWHRTAQAAAQAPAAQAHAVQGGHKHVVHRQVDHKHSAPTKAHGTWQVCCHPACTMAVVPSPAVPAQGFPLSVPLRSVADRIPLPRSPSGLDRPPKLV